MYNIYNTSTTTTYEYSWSYNGGTSTSSSTSPLRVVRIVAPESPLEPQMSLEELFAKSEDDSV